jgi:hypothetical protein
MEKNYIQNNLMICTPRQIFFGDQFENNEMGGECRMYEGELRCIQGFGRKREGKRPLGRPRRRWENNIKMGFK